MSDRVAPLSLAAETPKSASRARRAVSKLRQLGPFGVLAAIASTLPPLSSILLLTYIDAAAQWFRGHPLLGPLMYVVAFGIAGGVALVPTYAASALGGWAFGFGLGFVTVMGGIALAAMLAYLIGRRAAQDRLVRLLEGNAKSRVVYNALLGGSPAKVIWIITLLRLPPNAPFAITNLLLAGAKVGPLPYAIGTLIGMAPRTAAVCWIASRVSSERFQLLDNPWSFGIGLSITLAVLVAIGAMAKRALDHATRGKATSRSD